MANVNIKNLDPAVFLNSVGIGTSPSYDLHVKPSAGNADFVLEKASAASILIQANSTTTKMGSMSNHPLIFTANNAEKMRVLANGHVGLGTGSAVLAKLHIRGNSDTSDDDCSIRIVDADGTTGSVIPNIQFWTDSSQLYQIRANDALGLQFRNSSDATTFTVTNDGKVGIGHTEPSNRLTIKDGNSLIAFAEYNNGANIWLDGSNGDLTGGDYYNILADGATALRFGYGGANKISMLANGKLGIGTDSPDHLIEIDGSSSTDLLHLNSDAPILKVTATNNSSGLRINTVGQSSGQLLRVQKDGTTRFQVDHDGGIVMASLPTSDPGVAGALYRSGNDVKVSTG